MELKNITYTHYFAEPNSRTPIDYVHPITSRTVHGNETLEQVRVRYPAAEIIECDAWHSRRGKEQDAPLEWIEVTEEKYYDMLEVLPPASMRSGAFLVGEPVDHHAVTGQPRFSCYVHRNGKYFASSRPLQVSEFKNISFNLPK